MFNRKTVPPGGPIWPNAKRVVRCRLNRRPGKCGLPAGHGGDLHAVEIGDGVWFAYQANGRGRRVTSLGYGKFHDGEWRRLP